MENRIHLRVITSDGVVYERMASYVRLPLVGGSAGALARHTPLLAAVKDGSLKCCVGDATEYVYVGGGVADICKDEITVLTRVANRGEAIDLRRAEASEKRARERIAGAADPTDMARARQSLERAIARQTTYHLSHGGK